MWMGSCVPPNCCISMVSDVVYFWITNSVRWYSFINPSDKVEFAEGKEPENNQMVEEQFKTSLYYLRRLLKNDLSQVPGACTVTFKPKFKSTST